jgi:hypothetical protein
VEEFETVKWLMGSEVATETTTTTSDYLSLG